MFEFARTMPSSNPFDRTNLETVLTPGQDAWHNGSGSITYSFLSRIPDYYAFGVAGFEISEFFVSGNPIVSLSSEQRTLVDLAILAFNEVANVGLVETTGLGEITFGAHAFDDESLFGFAYLPGTAEMSGDLWLNNSMDVVAAPVLGDEGWDTILHELGHSIGLDHPFDGVVLDASLDSSRYTVMSYDPHPDQLGLAFEDRLWPVTPMLYDIAALQSLYGANMTTRTGNTTYFGTGEESAFALADGGAVIATIWDAGGRDKIDASGQSGTVAIDLRPGHFSSIGAIADNIAIAFDARIEDAAGGSGNDVLTGNGAWNRLEGNLGNDRLFGLDGFDTLNGGVGNDSLGGGNGNDRLFGGAGRDALWAGEGHDRLFGGGGGDRLVGNGGNDTLDGGWGNDVLTGGAGADVFAFASAPNPSSNVDRVVDFTVGEDIIRLEDRVFAAVGPAGHLSAGAFHAGATSSAGGAAIIYEDTTGGLFYDSNGSAPGGLVKFATLSVGLALTHDDFAVV